MATNLPYVVCMSGNFELLPLPPNEIVVAVAAMAVRAYANRAIITSINSHLTGEALRLPRFELIKDTYESTVQSVILADNPDHLLTVDAVVEDTGPRFSLTNLIDRIALATRVAMNPKHITDCRDYVHQQLLGTPREKSDADDTTFYATWAAAQQLAGELNTDIGKIYADDNTYYEVIRQITNPEEFMEQARAEIAEMQQHIDDQIIQNVNDTRPRLAGNTSSLHSEKLGQWQHVTEDNQHARSVDDERLIEASRQLIYYRYLKIFRTIGDYKNAAPDTAILIPKRKLAAPIRHAQANLISKNSGQ